MFSNATSPNGATSPNNPLNDSNKRYRRGYNRFNFSRTFYNTERYADINVIDVVEGVEKDVLPFGNKHDIRSYTLSSPIMFDIYKKKSYFMVDNKAILPINWDKVYKQPNKGDDVSDDVNCVVKDFIYIFKNTLDYIKELDFESGSTLMYNHIWRIILLFESVFSNGSLLASMNCHLSSSIRVYDEDDKVTRSTFDSWLEETYSHFTEGPFLYVFFPNLSNKIFTNDSDAVSIDPSAYSFLSSRQILDYMRTYSNFNMYYSANLFSSFEYLLNRLKLLRIDASLFVDDDIDALLNLSRLIAYQLVSVQFYTNDSVDNIYNADLFMQNAKDHAIESFSSRWPQFSYNGTMTDYDVFSGHVISKVLTSFLYALEDNDVGIYTYYDYLHMIFFYRKSLRYGDYFVGAKTLPYAPGDITADVVGDGVSALDMTRKTLMLRFLNAVARTRNTWKDYLRDVTDGIAPPNPLEPRFLASSTSRVGGFEVENTAEEQGNIVTILKSGNSNYVYEVEVGEPCIIIGVSTYEVPRVYSRTVERFFKHRDRFDMFNKFMQNIGDQEVNMGERSSAFSFSRVFGYTPRHMEYKQRYPIASGGFVEYLKGFAFITDNDESGQNDVDFTSSGLRISSSFIRNKNSEMDRFYKSLTGLTLASYFHFIVKYDCIVDAKRAMEYQPSIL